MQEQYFSQHGQDKLINYILKNKRNGIFIDIGAHDGVTFSNSVFFEKFRDYNGICFEPNPKVYDQLIINRKCICLNKAVSSISGYQTFKVITGYAEMLSGLTNYMDVRHEQRQSDEIMEHGGEITTIEVETTSLAEIDFLKDKEIDFLSIDTEGGEFEILKSIDFSKIKINIISCEINYSDVGDKINKLIISNGFSKLTNCGSDALFISNSINSSFYIKKIKFILKIKEIFQLFKSFIKRSIS